MWEGGGELGREGNWDHVNERGIVRQLERGKCMGRDREEEGEMGLRKRRGEVEREGKTAVEKERGKCREAENRDIT